MIATLGVLQMIAIIITILLVISPLWIVSELKEVRKAVEKLIALEILDQKSKLNK